MRIHSIKEIKIPYVRSGVVVTGTLIESYAPDFIIDQRTTEMEEIVRREDFGEFGEI